MKSFVAWVAIVAGICSTACEQQHSVTGPTAAPSDAAVGVHANLTAPLVSDACRPPANSVVFDTTQLGRVTITNNSPCANDFLYIVWLVSPNDASHQTPLAAAGAHLTPGERRTLTLGFEEVCGSKYQRDVYIGISDGSIRYSDSDVANYFFAALGYYQYAAPCPTPPSTPPTNQPTVAPTNVALNKVAVASSFETVPGPGDPGFDIWAGSTNSASNAIDGNMATRWSSQFSDPQWIYVDLGRTYNITEVILRWEIAFGLDYQVQVSDDALTWTTIRTVTNGDGGVDDLAGLSASGRYVRIYGTRRGTHWGYSLWEFEVYGL